MTEVAVFREVVYAQPPGFRPLRLDLHVPPEPAALCLYLHGGGWRVGSRTRPPFDDPSFFERIARLGLAVASIEYRLSGEARFPAPLEDLTGAARYLAEHRRDFGVSTDATVSWGVSAGGHLAALHALTTPTPAVSAVVCWYAPTDLLHLPDDIDAAGGQADRGPGSREALLLGATAAERPDLARAASPVHAVRQGPPPFLLMHGDRDVAVPCRQSHRLARALRTVGGVAGVEEVPGAGHMFPELGLEALRRLAARSARWLLRHV
ncbi:alpha/beta hydrolase [Planomonospora sp. ID67723]|uniref:alpha/beta hydrolase n=1 Tax=Planomonospora sp. ID67723 TaxID=2738134 RepID=UPI0018C38C8F|nr:alpha/beta hydrolase [Planomonospora sp. ID67723]MBG0830074.1 alpha/beta hydrolase [Planomonospora sp. ID67723]